jgi:hypothetical protein
VETQEEKPDWNDWASIVRWAARLDPDSAVARALAQGVPVGPPLGADIAPDDVRIGPRITAPPDASLTVISGYLDDARQAIGPRHRLYASATYAYAYRDYWTDCEHRDYWRTHLHLWPGRTGRRGNRESLAFAIVSTDTLGVPVEELLSGIGYSRDDLRDRNVLDLADRMRDELDRGPSAVRVPIVVTDEELDHMPLLTAYQTLDPEEGAANAKVSALARQVVMRASAEVAARASHRGER